MRHQTMSKPENKITLFFERFANRTTRLTGSSMAFVLAFLVIIVWLASGPIFNYSDTWQLVINTSTTIITFLMVFLIQKSQNKDGMAMQLKLNELIAASKEASNRLVDVESLTEHELRTLSEYYATLAKEAAKASNIHESHSVEEAIEDAQEKIEFKKGAKQKNRKE
jgi:low affinity Fe/Cu permease